MNPVPLLRFASLAALLGSIITLILSGGAFAQNYAAIPGGTRPTPASSTPDLPLQPAGSNTSALNWAGYVATGGTYTSVSGSWIVPTVDGGNSNVADATWVGIGGVVSSDLIQAGTEAIPDTSGAIVYRAWLETLPQDSQEIPLSVSPGDAVSVSITEESQGTWDVAFDDATTGKTYQTTVQYDSSLSSADWIEEMPVEVGGVVGLDNFGEVRFSAGYAIENGEPATIASAGATPLTMDNSEGVPVAEPSVLGADGASFTVLRTDAASTPLALSRDGVSAIPIDTEPYAYDTSGEGGFGGGYTIRVHRQGSGYRIIVQF